MADPTSEESRDPEDDEPSGFARFYERNRRRFQLVALAIFLVAVGLEVGGAVPRDVSVSLRLPAPEDVREATIAYRQEGELVRELQRRFPEGAPRDLRDELELSPGDYDVEVRVTEVRGGTRTLRGHLTAPAEGVIHVALD